MSHAIKLSNANQMSKAISTSFLCPYRISGIPCFLARDLDSFIVYDRKGYKADWLERKLTWNDHVQVFEALDKFDKENFR
jgi:hypothetical protein